MKPVFVLSFCLCISASATSIASAQDSAGIPEKALKELDFMAGKWQTDVYEGDKKIGTTTHQRRWSPGKYCLLFSTSVELNDEKFEASGISGWTENERAIVEHWYGSNGASLTVSYPLEKMKGNVWEGTYHRVNANGSQRKGPCKLVKGDGQWTYTAEWEEDGETMRSKSVTRKVED